MPEEHGNLLESMLHFLSSSTEAEIWVTAGFHTGRAKLVAFFDTAESMNLEVSHIYERDVNGRERAWKRERDGGLEDITERKRWLVIAVLKRKLLGPQGSASSGESIATFALSYEEKDSTITLVA